MYIVRILDSDTLNRTI